jgi:hypothetical protein
MVKSVLVAVFIDLLFIRFAGEGVALIGNAIHWRRHASRVLGTRIGSSEHNGFHFPVYEYTLPNGQRCKGKSSHGSEGREHFRIGDQRVLLVFASDPQHVREARQAWEFVIGGMMIMATCTWLHSVIEGGQPEFLKWTVMAAAVYYCVYRFRFCSDDFT